jgi:methionyl-tRNA synthetase
MLGKDVVFVCGSDTHGTPIVINAEERNMTPKELIKIYHRHFKEIFEKMSIEFDYYGSTDDYSNHHRTQEIVLELIRNGYVYSKTIPLAYCPVCDRFLPDRYVEGTCPYCGMEARGDECDQGCGRHLEPGEILNPRCKIDGAKAEYREQEHYFFRLSSFKEFLLRYLEDLKGTENALNYAREWVKRELKDWCISRNLDWGVKFPGRDDMVVYVWVDAPIGYISFTEEYAKRTGINWEEIWKEKSEIVHFIGLDIVYHHCIFWPAMLKGAGYTLPSAVVASGMVKIQDKTFSKSRGYVVWVEDDYLKEGFHPDYLRYYLVNYTSHQKDLNFSWKIFEDKVNNELVNTLGNFMYRVLHFTWKNFGRIPEVSVSSEIIKKIEEARKNVIESIESYEFKEASDAVMELASFGNSYFQHNKPWELIKSNLEKCQQVIKDCLQIVKALTILFYPVMPSSMKEIGDIIGIDTTSLKIEDVQVEISPLKLSRPSVPFKKIEKEKIIEMQEKLIRRIEKMGNTDTQEYVTLEDFQKMNIRIGKIIAAERIKGSSKLLKLEVDIGDEKRQIVAGFATSYRPEELIGELVPILVNMKPAKLMGVESQGMILAADVNGKPVLLKTEKEVPTGSIVR